MDLCNKYDDEFMRLAYIQHYAGNTSPVSYTHLVPVVMFYPGEYDGQELVLFGEIKDDNYYRAFKLVD